MFFFIFQSPPRWGGDCSPPRNFPIIMFQSPPPGGGDGLFITYFSINDKQIILREALAFVIRSRFCSLHSLCQSSNNVTVRSSAKLLGFLLTLTFRGNAIFLKNER